MGQKPYPPPNQYGQLFELMGISRWDSTLSAQEVGISLEVASLEHAPKVMPCHYSYLKALE